MLSASPHRTSGIALDENRKKGMPPKLVSDDGKNIVIRPLAYVAETDLERWAVHRQFPIIPCTLCGSQENLQRVQIKQMLREWDRNMLLPRAPL